MQVKATISYNGNKFYGFQRQSKNSQTVVESIEKALQSLGITSKIRGSGRTDRGVHATGQVIDFTLPEFWQCKSPIELKKRLNQKLKDVKFKHISVVGDDFHSQYSAKVRVYRYLIKTTQPSVFEQEFVSFYQIKDSKILQEALALYIGTHNFKNFKKEGSPTTSDIREVYNVKLKKVKNYYAIYFYASGYLRSQVRMMIEGALSIESGKLSKIELKEQLEGSKKHFTTLAQPQGLYLAKVYY